MQPSSREKRSAGLKAQGCCVFQYFWASSFACYCCPLSVFIRVFLASCSYDAPVFLQFVIYHLFVILSFLSFLVFCLCSFSLSVFEKVSLYCLFFILLFFVFPSSVFILLFSECICECLLISSFFYFCFLVFCFQSSFL